LNAYAEELIERSRLEIHFPLQKLKYAQGFWSQKLCCGISHWLDLRLENDYELQWNFVEEKTDYA